MLLAVANKGLGKQDCNAWQEINLSFLDNEENKIYPNILQKQYYQYRFHIYNKPQPVATETDDWAACLHFSEQLLRWNQALIVIHVVVLRLGLMIPAGLI